MIKRFQRLNALTLTLALLALVFGGVCQAASMPCCPSGAGDQTDAHAHHAMAQTKAQTKSQKSSQALQDGAAYVETTAACLCEGQPTQATTVRAGDFYLDALAVAPASRSADFTLVETGFSWKLLASRWHPDESDRYLRLRVLLN